MRTELPKPILLVWAKRRKVKTNQSEQKWTGAPERTRTSDLLFRKSKRSCNRCKHRSDFYTYYIHQLMLWQFALSIGKLYVALSTC